MKTWADRDSKKIPLLPGVSVKQLTESLQNENSAATPFLPEGENITGIYVENQSNFGTNGYNKPGPAVAAAPEMWNIQFIKG